MDRPGSVRRSDTTQASTEATADGRPSPGGRSGVVLAGGTSRRFGRNDKALAELDGDPLIRRVVDRVSTVVGEVIVGCRPGQVEPFERVLQSSPVDEIVVDRSPGAGPLAGIEAGLDVASGTYAAVVACDMPFVDPAVLESLFEKATGTDGAVPEQRDGRLQPLQAVYRTTAMLGVAVEMLPREGSVQRALDALDVVVVPNGPFPERSFYNVNTPGDFAAAKRRWCE